MLNREPGGGNSPAVGRGHPGGPEGFWLFVGALEPYKRSDLAIAAANKTGCRLVIAGAGSQERYLRSLAGPTVTFEGRVSDDRLRELYRTAAVLLFPQVEDFGIVAVEAQACGLPVIAFARGGAIDSVVDGTTGLLFGEQDEARGEPREEDLLAAIERMGGKGAAVVMGHSCRANALRFSEAQFDRKMLAAIDRCLTSPSDTDP